MVARINTVAFQGIEAVPVDVQVQISSGFVGFTIVGLPDKAVAESRERIRAALTAVGLSLPPKRITINLAPADLPKAGSHYDLAIAACLLTATGVLPGEALSRYIVLGELALDGSILPVAGALPSAIAAQAQRKGIICPASSGPEAAWAGDDIDIVAPDNLIQLINHFKGTQLLLRPRVSPPELPRSRLDLRDIKGNESAKRALEVAAAGAHNLLMIGPPGAGKSMLAQRLPTILPPMTAAEILETSMINSVAGEFSETRLSPRRPFRTPHHTASQASLVGGGLRARPGEMSLAHNGVLFLDELPEFQPRVLEALRQPLETGLVVVARANNHVTYPARFQLVAAMNPCRCGFAGQPGRTCPRGPRCAAEYQARLSGPLLDRIDIVLEVAAVSIEDLSLPAPREGSEDVARRVAAARSIQLERYQHLADQGIRTNAMADGEVLTEFSTPDSEGLRLLQEVANRARLSARGYHRTLRVARTIADLAGEPVIRRVHVAEALSYRNEIRTLSLAA